MRCSECGDEQVPRILHPREARLRAMARPIPREAPLKRSDN